MYRSLVFLLQSLGPQPAQPGLLTLAGGLVITFAKEILDLGFGSFYRVRTAQNRKAVMPWVESMDRIEPERRALHTWNDKLAEI